MYPLECLILDLEYLLGSRVPSNLDKIEGMLLPSAGIRQAFGVFEIAENAKVDQLNNIYYKRDFSLLCANSAYDIIDNRLFGYHLWDADFTRFYYELGYPPVHKSHVQINQGWVAGLKNARMYSGSTLYTYHPLRDNKYEFFIQMRRDDFGLADELFNDAMSRAQQIMDIAKK